MAAAAPIISAIVANNIKGAILRFALSLAISYITQRVFGDQQPGAGGNQSQKDPGVKQRIPSDPANKLPVIYGEERIFGSIIYADISSDNKTMAFIIALCEGPINHIGDVFWEDYKLTLDGNNEVSNATHTDGSTDDWLNGNLTIHKYPDGGRCTQMEAFSSKWASNAENRAMPDAAYAYCELKYDRENNVTGLTNKLGFDIEGKLIRTINSNGTLNGPAPRTTPLRDIFNLDIFDKNVSFSDFSGNQITHWSSGGIIPSQSIGRGSPHAKVAIGGTLQIVDLGDDPNTGSPASVTAYMNGTGSAYGSGTGATAELVFLEPGEYHTDNHNSNTTSYSAFVPTPYTDNSGVVHSDDGYRIVNGLKITSWGNNYSVSNFSTGSNQLRVHAIYTYTDVHGATYKTAYSLGTAEFNNSNQTTDAGKANILINSVFSSAYGNDPETYGIRRKRDPYVNNEPIYIEHQQYFTAKLPYVVGEAARGFYSNNPAECLLDYMTNKIYGCGLSIEDTDIDIDTFYDHKLFCDDLVTHNDPDGASVTSKRYQCNGFANTNDSKDLNISDIVSNSQSIFSYTLGKFQMISDTVGNNQATFDDTNIYGNVTVVDDGFNSALNQVTLRFKSKSQNYQDDQVFLDFADIYFNEPILSKDLDLKFINTNVEAQRLGTVLVNKSRSSNLISFKTDTRAANLQVNDVITVQDTYYNLNTERKLYANLSNSSNNGLSDNNVIGQMRFRDNDEYQTVLYKDGTEAMLSMPYNASTHTQLLTFFKECINGQYEDNTFTLTKEQEKQNNKLGELVNLVINNEDYTTGGTYGGGFIFHLNNYSMVYKNSPNDVRFENITNIHNTTWSVGIEAAGARDGSLFKVNSISETELDGGLQGYYITAQEYNSADYTVGVLTAKAVAPNINSSRGYTNISPPNTLTLNNTYPNAAIPYIDISMTMPDGVEGIEVYYSDTSSGTRYFMGNFNASSGTYTTGSVESFNIQNIPTSSDLYIWIRSYNAFARSNYSTGLSVGNWAPANASTNVGPGAVGSNSIQTGAIGASQISNSFLVTTAEHPTHTVDEVTVLTTSASDDRYLQNKPTVADVSQTIAPATATTITITGTNFDSIPIVEFIKTDGSVTLANTVSFTSSLSLSVNATLATGNYYVRVENPDGNAGRSTNNIITASTAPTWTTNSGSLGTFAGNFSGTLATVAGTSDSTVAYSETTSVLSGAGVTLNTSTGALTTTDFGASSTTPTTYNFTLRLTDAESQTADRSFSMTSTYGATGGGQFN
tara:strand:+ start:4158 stop:7958 length:3801 start_codon:yes stop_codon:yes gene_type:complete